MNIYASNKACDTLVRLYENYVKTHNEPSEEMSRENILCIFSTVINKHPDLMFDMFVKDYQTEKKERHIKQLVKEMEKGLKKS